MCGIVGYVGKEQAAPILLDGLRRLEYRGYDSTGIAVCGAGTLRVEKSRGRLQVLSDLTHEGADLPGTCLLYTSYFLLRCIKNSGWPSFTCIKFPHAADTASKGGMYLW